MLMGSRTHSNLNLSKRMPASILSRAIAIRFSVTCSSTGVATTIAVGAASITRFLPCLVLEDQVGALVIELLSCHVSYLIPCHLPLHHQYLSPSLERRIRKTSITYSITVNTHISRCQLHAFEHVMSTHNMVLPCVTGGLQSRISQLCSSDRLDDVQVLERWQADVLALCEVAGWS